MRSAVLPFAFVAILAAATVPVVSAQERVIISSGPEGGQIPGMPGARPPKTGNGRIVGRVVAAETGTAIRRAQVRIMGPDIGSKAALTDADGRYEFRDLPAGRFNMTASKSGYVTVQYGQTRPHETGRPIELAEKQVLDKADFSMPRGGVIAGRVVDEFGEPVADAMVAALRQVWAAGRRRFVPAGRMGQTNDLGQFRMYGLPPGDYYVSATLRNAESMVFEVMGAQGGPTGSTPASGYAPTYYPGTPSPAEAQKVTVGVGQEAHQTDFALLPVRLAKVSGTVISSDGKPVENAMINMVPTSRTGEVGMMMMMGTSSRTAKDGRFTVNGVAPGDYTLNARTIRMSSDGAGGAMFVTGMAGPGGDDAEFAAMPVGVAAGEDLANVMVVTTKGATVSGRFVFEGGGRPDNVAALRINAMAAEMMDGPMIGGSGGTAKADGSFEIKGLAGNRMLRVMNLPPGWMMKTVRAGGADITDTGMEFKAGEQVSNVEIVVTSRVTEIAGGVSLENGTPAKDYTVVVFSDDPDHWTTFMSRRVTGARPDQDGRFKIRNLPAGSYYAAAVDYVEAGGWGDPELLERLKTSAKRFTIAEGQTETLDLKLSQ